MSSAPSHNNAAFQSESACEPTAVPAGVSRVALPLRPQRAGVNARQWILPDPEIMRRVKAPLARL